MIINITVLEDNEYDFSMLSNCIQTWAKETGNMVNISWINCLENIHTIASNIKCDIFFSDIEIDKNSHVSGIDICKELRNAGYTGLIIFLTAFKEYVFDGYDVQAFNYLIKPINQTSIDNCMNKYITLYSNDFYYHHKGNEIIQIPYYEIIYIEKNGHYTFLHTLDKIFVERISLNEMVNRLPGNFIRAHKSYIVNVHKIKNLMLNQLTLCNNEIIKVGRNFLPDIKTKLLEIARK